MNHVNVQDLKWMAKQKPLGLPAHLKDSFPPMNCSGCSQCKMQQAPHTGSTTRPPPGHTLVTDLAEVERSEHGYLHFMTVTELHTRFKWVYLLKRKREAQRYLIEAVTKIQRHFNHTVTKIRCDNANEYLTQMEIRVMAQQGTAIIPIIPHTSQQNSVAERANRTIMGKVRATLAAMNLPFKSYWPCCVLDTVIKQNSSFQRTVQDIPRKLFEACRSDYSPYPRRSLNLQQFRYFGEIGFIPDLRDKLRKRDSRAILVRYLFCAHPGRFKVIVPETGQLLLCRVTDFRPYNPNFDPRRLLNPDTAIQPERRVPRINAHHVHVTEAHATHGLQEHDPTSEADRPLIDSTPHGDAPANRATTGEHATVTTTPAAQEPQTAQSQSTAVAQQVTPVPSVLAQVPPPAPPKTLRQARNAADAEMWQAAYAGNTKSQ